MTLLFIKEYNYLVKTTKDIAIQPQEHKQQLFGSPKTRVPHFKLQKVNARMIKFHRKYFIESTPYDEKTLKKIIKNNQCFKNVNKTKLKITRFQIYPETELVCKYNTSFYKTQYSKILVEYGKGFDMKTGKLIFKPNPTYHISNCVQVQDCTIKHRSRQILYSPTIS